MEQRLSIVTIGVRDLEKSRKFYDALGWVVASEDDINSIVTYNLQSMALALYPIDKLIEDTTVNIDKTGYSPFTLAYNVLSESAVNSTLEEANKAGGKIIKKAQKAFWGGYSGYFSDLDSTLWEVAYNPFSKLGENGQFQWGGS